MSGDPALVRPTRIPKCTRCRNHGLVVPVRGHSGHCMWKLCNCPKCSLITERHKILEEHKLLRRPRTEEPPPTEDRTPDRTGNTAPRAAQAESPDLKRKKMSPTRISSFETVKRSPATVLTGPPMYPTEYLQTLDYFARETTRMYLGCPPIYHYPAFPIGGPASGFRNAFIPLSTRSTPASSVFPFRGLRPYYPLQDVRGDFRPSYYSPIPQYIPPGYLPSPHYMPSTVPMNVSFMAEPNTSLFGQAVPHSQSLGIESGTSETPAHSEST
ncbi:doublesex- and mab-3-related transcription factor B1 [Hyla sarda]|uniref:doublesex- and mab-3-related transcription factor B1 n=1 Tax=Hyla sarda TaxID=327740 RepID=UPI0024C21981|nr:doublesex- and mab-3-related transcription factor B1 [Hyla sarda]